MLRISLAGALLGSLIISFFVLGVDAARPEWGRYWMLKPYIVTPLVAGLSALGSYLVIYKTLRSRSRAAALVLSAVTYVVGLWMGIVLGLNGTLWD
jgi:hypothetical protein